MQNYGPKIGAYGEYGEYGELERIIGFKLCWNLVTVVNNHGYNWWIYGDNYE